MSENIVITGLGCISGAGNNLAEFEKQIFQEQNNLTIAPVTLFSPNEGDYHIAAEVKNYQAKDHFKANELKLLDRYAQFAIISAEEAIKHAQLDIKQHNPNRISVIHGTSIGGQETIESSYLQLFNLGKKRAHPLTVPKLLPSAATGQISMRLGIKGPSFTTSSACSSSGHAIAMAVLMLRANIIDIAIVGGAEACITKGNFLAWDGLRVLSNDTCRPFSKERSGLVLGEGAGTLILEKESIAQSRNANILAKISGIGMSSDAHNAVQPLAEGAQNAMQAALDDANLNAEDIDYINAHGSATLQNDQTESQAITATFQDKNNSPLVSSTKSTHGHVLGAGAAIEAIASILSIQRQQIPATTNFITPDSLCDINIVANEPKQTKINAVLSNSFAFGGLNTALIFEKY